MDAKEIQEALQTKFDEFKGKTLSPDQFETFKSEFNKDIDEKIKTASNNEQELKAIKDDSEKAINDLKAEFQSKFDAQEEIQKKQGEELAKKKEQVMTSQNPFKDFEDKFKEASQDVTDHKYSEIKFSFKTDQVFSTQDIAATTYAPGSLANVDQSYAQSIVNLGNRVYEAPKRKPNLLDGVNTLPITEGQLGAVVKYDEQGDAAVIDECAIKPYASVKFKVEYEPSGTIAVLWKESKKWRTNFSRLLPSVRIYMRELMGRRIETEIFEGNDTIKGLTTLTSPFVPNASLVFDLPGKLEAIGAVIYSQMSLEFDPKVIKIHPIDYATMAHSKALDGHYDTFNNGSIRLLNGTQIISGGNIINLQVDNLVAPGSFFVGDMDLAKIGIGNSVEFEQAYTDDDFTRNLVTNRLEIDAAVMIPTVVRGGFFYGTYESVLPQITA